MKLYIVRHGEPDYEKDGLTGKGKREAQLLADRMEQIRPDHIYVSNLGRARETAAPTLERLGREEVVFDWLQEFVERCVLDDGRESYLAWDMLPSMWMQHPEYFTSDEWQNSPLARSCDSAVVKRYHRTIAEFDALLEKHGYRRNGHGYDVLRANTESIALFCHFGLESVLLSHLLNLPLFVLWHQTVALPTSVTTVVTEEREKGIASWRMMNFGDVSHLTDFGEEPSFAGRFCEIYDDFSQRH